MGTGKPSSLRKNRKAKGMVTMTKSKALSKSFLKTVGFDTSPFPGLTQKKEVTLQSKLENFANKENGSVDEDNPSHIYFSSKTDELHIYGSLDIDGNEHYQAILESCVPTKFKAGELKSSIEEAVKNLFK